MEPILVGDLLEELNELNSDGFRVLAVANKKVEKRAAYSKADEDGLVLTGYLAFLDPPKETAAKAIAGLNRHGVTVKVLTGDNDLVTRKICTEVGLKVDKILLGNEVEKMSALELSESVVEVNVFARLSPAHKQRIVKALQEKGHTVGFMGDGINDAPALHAADVGVSVDNAVDIAKKSADVILLEKSLMVLEEGVLEGRKVFVNILNTSAWAPARISEHVQRDRRQRLASFRADGSHSSAHQQSALRLFPGANPDRQRWPATDSKAAALAYR